MKDRIPPSESKLWKLAATYKRLGSSLALVLVLAITVTSINSVSSGSEQVQAKPYDGVTLYRGLFFASGPLVSKIPSLRKATPYFPAEYKSLEGAVIKYIREKDPGFFDRFAAEIQSGDRLKVAAAIKNTNKLQKEALVAITKNSRSRFASQVRQQMLQAEPEPTPESDKELVKEIVVIILDVGIILATVADKTPPGVLKGLSFERYVNEIVSAVPKISATRPSVANPRD